MSLATDYRPKDFSDVVGQSTIVNTLVKEFENNGYNVKILNINKGQKEQKCTSGKCQYDAEIPHQNSASECSDRAKMSDL